MSDEEIIKDVVEIVELAKGEIESNDENITATLDLQDLKSLKGLLDLYNKIKQELESVKEIYYTENEVEELRNKNAELRDKLEVKNAELNKEKEKNKELSDKLTLKICQGVEEEVLELYRQKLKNSISKDRIKTKIEEYKGYENLEIYEHYNYGEIIQVLQELLGETNE